MLLRDDPLSSVMLQLLTGEPMFDVSRHEDTHFPLFVRLGIDECLEDEEKALEIMFSNKDTVKKIRQAVSVGGVFCVCLCDMYMY